MIKQADNTFKTSSLLTQRMMDDINLDFEAIPDSPSLKPHFNKIQSKLNKIEESHHKDHKSDEEEEKINLEEFKNIEKEIAEFNSSLKKQKKFDDLRTLHEKQDKVY